MRDRTALAVLLAALVLAVAGWQVASTELAADDPPDATFSVSGDAAGGELVVEHDGGPALAPGSVRVLVYEERRVLPDRTVHGSTWDDGAAIGPGDRLVLEDPRFEPGQRLVVRWYGDGGQATLSETRL